MLQDAVAGFEITLGKEHPSTLISKRYIALVRFELRETHLTQAVSELKEVLVGLAAQVWVLIIQSRWTCSVTLKI